jgi:hyperosmotically inducible protein
MSSIHSFRKRLLVASLTATLAAVPLAQAAAQDGSAPQHMSQSNDNRTVPDKMADGWITTKVKSEFAAARQIKASDISVSTRDGVVSLTGTVATNLEKNQAIRIAHGVKGVKRVDASGLTVAATSSSD